MSNRTEVESAAQAVQDALTAWNAAPLHVKAMAGAYVKPLLWALASIARALEAIDARKL